MFFHALVISTIQYYIFEKLRNTIPPILLHTYVLIDIGFCISGSLWREPNADLCEGQTQPVSGPNYPGGPHPAELVVEKVLRGMSKPVYLLNVTVLSQLRKDGHPSFYGGHGHKHSAMDCSHWCLAGVPDTWNQLLYAALTHSAIGS